MLNSVSPLLLLGILVASVSAKWCCGDIDTEVTAQIKAVVRSRVVQVNAMETYNLRTGYKICPNNTIAEKDVPKGLGDNTEDTSENRDKLKNQSKNRLGLFGLLFGGNGGKLLGDDEYHSYCPVYTVKSRMVTKYSIETYNTAMFDDEKASCPANKKVCCRGFKQVGDNCVEEGKADSANDALDFLNSLGIVG